MGSSSFFPPSQLGIEHKILYGFCVSNLDCPARLDWGLTFCITIFPPLVLGYEWQKLDYLFFWRRY